jgi:hypothetical protein
MPLTPEQSDALLLLLFGFVVLVGAFAWLPKPRWLDRLWLWAIFVSFVIWTPIGLIIAFQDLTWWAFIIPVGFLVLFTNGLIDGLRGRDSAGTSAPQPPQHQPDSPPHGQTSA